MPVNENFIEKARRLYAAPFFDLISEAHLTHREHHDPGRIQRCALLSIKTGGCPEDCGYCPQSAHHETDLARSELLELDHVLEAAKIAKKNGAQRFCMGAAWREVKDGPEFERVLEMVRSVANEGLETCATLGMLNHRQAVRLKEAGLHAYNHNLDTSRRHYGQIITTRTYEDRLRTLKAVRASGIQVCSGGIVGMGESAEDRCALLAELAALDPQPESVPINMLVRVPGTPLADSEAVSALEWVRTIAVARILMPKAMVRLAAGRHLLSEEAQALAFFAGANSIFLGEKLLTQPNPELEKDTKLFSRIDLPAP